MISDDILKKVRFGVCSVGYLTVTLEEFVRDPAGGANYKILGTGFLVRDTVVMTNRHVLRDLNTVRDDRGIPDEQRLLQFVYPRAGGWQTGYCQFVFASYIQNPDVDIAFIQFNRRPEAEFQQCRPVVLSDDVSAIRVGQPIGMFGYPEGTGLLVNNLLDKERIYRFGPVLQQGYVSAVAPYDGTTPISRILSDIRTIGGMSGSPVFYSNSGDVFAIHEAGNKLTTAFSIPIYKSEVLEWLELHDQTMTHKARELEGLSGNAIDQ